MNDAAYPNRLGDDRGDRLEVFRHDHSGETS